MPQISFTKIKKEIIAININEFRNDKLNMLVNNREQLIKQMLGFSQKRLDKNYKLVCQQMQIAFGQHNHKAYEILQEMESQILEALVLKLD